MNKYPTLAQVSTRIKYDNELMKKYPHKKDMLSKRIERHKELIVKIVMDNADNLLLKQIVEKSSDDC